MASPWRHTTLSEIGDIITGKTPSSARAEYFDGYIPFVTPSDFDGRRKIDSTARALTESGAASLGRVLVPASAIFVSCIGSDMGKAAISGGDCVTNQQINSLIVGANADPLFVFYNLSTRKEEIRRIASGSAQPILNKSAFGRLDILLPPLPEQRAIASVLGALDDKIELNQKTNATLEAMAGALFKSWFVDFDPVRAKAEGRDPGLPPEIAALFPDSFENVGLEKIPKGWRKTSIYEIADVIYGAPFGSRSFNSERLGLPLIRIRDLKDQVPEVYTTEEHPRGYLAQPGDLLVGMDGEFRPYMWCGAPGWMNQRVCCFQPKPDVSRAYVHFVIESLLAEVERSETATTVIHLGKSDIDHFRVLEPPMPLLQCYGQVADEFEKRILLCRQEAHILAVIRDTLVPKLISGEVRVGASRR
jgi:type I restriction enzyme, S subunit